MAGATFGVLMAQATIAELESVVWWYTRQEIGRGLRKHYEQTDELPPQLLVLVKKLDDDRSPPSTVVT
jgi:hypothetical protein